MILSQSSRSQRSNGPLGASLWITFFSSVLISVLSLPVEAGTELKLVQGTIDPTVIESATDLEGSGPREFVIQWSQSITEQDKQELQILGVMPLRYLPDDALIVRGEIHDVHVFLSNHPRVRAVVSYQPAWKRSLQLQPASVFSTHLRNNFTITVFFENEREQILERIRELDPQLQVLQSQGRTVILNTLVNSIPAISGLVGIEFIDPMSEIHTLNMKLNLKDNPPAPSGNYQDLTGYESGSKVLNLDSAWRLGYFGAGQIAGMADTGLDAGSINGVDADFKGAIHSGYAKGIGAKDWSDPMGHGTHVAGSVVGRGVISGGKIVGGANQAQLVVSGMWSPIVDNLTVPPQLADLFAPAYSDGARIHTNSWGAAANFGAYDNMAQQVDEFMWEHPDFLILFAAGNSGVDHDKDGRIDPNSIGSPGTAKNCVTVGASKNYVLKGGIQKKISDLKAAPTDWSTEPIWSSSLSENPQGLAMFSSRGPTQDNRVKPDVVAPGTNVLSTRSHIPGAELLWGAYNDDYLWSGGTSMATPVAAGFATVAREILAKKYGVKAPSAALLKAVLLHTAKDLYPGQFGLRAQGQELLTVRPNNDEGYGRLDMNGLLGLGSDAKFIDHTEGLGEGETLTQSLDVPAGKTLMANIVYTDAPGTPAAGAALVNDLDLSIVAPDGQISAANDHVNNAEIVNATSHGGVFRVQVKGFKVPMGHNGKQPFALVISTY